MDRPRPCVRGHRLPGQGILSPMTEPRPTSPNAYPPPPRRRPSEERAAIAASTRTATQVAVIAVVVAVVALGLTLWRIVQPSGSSCQTTAWDAAPAADQLPAGWAVKGVTFDIDRKTTSFVGPDTGDPSIPQPVVLATVTCYPEGAADSVTRSAAASKAIGQVVTNRDDLGDQAYQAADASGAIFIQLRHGDVVADLAASGGTTQTEVDEIASAYDRALGGDGGTIASPEPSAGSSGDIGLASPGASGSAGPSASPAAPELEKLLPTKVGAVGLTVDSALGSTVLTNDQGSRAITAALRAEGKGPDALRLAEAFDPTQATDLNMLAVKVDGMSVDKVQQLVLDSWLAASGAGVTQSKVTLGGHEFIRVDLGDEGPIDYVTTKDGVVFVITTSDATLAAQAAATLP